jgi:tRNA(adenine34) deaminase
MVDSGIMHDECSKLLSAFFKRRREEKKIAKKQAKQVQLK